MKKPIKIQDLGGPALFLETPTWGSAICSQLNLSIR